MTVKQSKEHLQIFDQFFVYFTVFKSRRLLKNLLKLTSDDDYSLLCILGSNLSIWEIEKQRNG